MNVRSILRQWGRGCYRERKCLKAPLNLVYPCFLYIGSVAGDVPGMLYDWDLFILGCVYVSVSGTGTKGGVTSDPNFHWPTFPLYFSPIVLVGTG